MGPADGRETFAITAPAGDFLDTLWRLALPWYGDRLDPDWEPHSRERNQALLQDVGLTGPFWALP